MIDVFGPLESGYKMWDSTIVGNKTYYEKQTTLVFNFLEWSRKKRLRFVKLDGKRSNFFITYLDDSENKVPGYFVAGHFVAGHFVAGLFRRGFISLRVISSRVILSRGYFVAYRKNLWMACWTSSTAGNWA
jgi:hypothetical protein